MLCRFAAEPEATLSLRRVRLTGGQVVSCRWLSFMMHYNAQVMGCPCGTRDTMGHTRMQIEYVVELLCTLPTISEMQDLAMSSAMPPPHAITSSSSSSWFRPFPPAAARHSSSLLIRDGASYAFANIEPRMKRMQPITALTRI
eukprot:6200378-Pleurochrysis_carterae.AAC.1